MAAPSPPELRRGVSAATSEYSLEDSPQASDNELLEEGEGRQNNFENRQEKRPLPTKTLDRDSLQASRNEIIAEVVDVLGITEDDAAIVLSHMSWDGEELSEKVFDDENFLPNLRKKLRLSEGCESEAQADGLCEICFCDPPIAGVVPCGHGYCSDCWHRYVSLSVDEGKGCLDLRCPAPKCGERLRPSQVENLCSSEPLVRRYRRFLLDSFVEEHRSRKWCPSALCDLACEKGPNSTVECTCGMQWCFECCNDDHAPVPCAIVQKWNEKQASEGADISWIMVNTKNCPKCKNPIEKNGGCMHMTCRKPGGCGHEFCWICMKDWLNHSNCNGLEGEETPEIKQERRQLELLAFFYNRFQVHEVAQKKTAEDLRARMSVCIECLSDDPNFNIKDASFLMDATEQLVRCRRFLKWTYAYGYFLKTTYDTRKLFEFHQGQLESTLEKLSDLVENTRWEDYMGRSIADNKEFFRVKSNVISLTSVVRQFFDSLSNWIQDTFDK